MANPADTNTAAKLRSSLATLSLPIPGMRRELMLDRVIGAALRQYQPADIEHDTGVVKQALVDRVMTLLGHAMHSHGQEVAALQGQVARLEARLANTDSIFTENELRKMRVLNAYGVTRKELAVMYGVDVTRIRRALAGLDKPAARAVPTQRRKRRLDLS